MTDEELRDVVRQARAKIHASGAGSMHGMWEVVFDAELILSGEHEKAIATREQVSGYLSTFIAPPSP